MYDLREGLKTPPEENSLYLECDDSNVYIMDSFICQACGKFIMIPWGSFIIAACDECMEALGEYDNE